MDSTMDPMLIRKADGDPPAVRIYYSCKMHFRDRIPSRTKIMISTAGQLMFSAALWTIISRSITVGLIIIGVGISTTTTLTALAFTATFRAIPSITFSEHGIHLHGRRRTECLVPWKQVDLIGLTRYRNRILIWLHHHDSDSITLFLNDVGADFDSVDLGGGTEREYPLSIAYTSLDVWQNPQLREAAQLSSQPHAFLVRSTFIDFYFSPAQRKNLHEFLVKLNLENYVHGQWWNPEKEDI